MGPAVQLNINRAEKSDPMVFPLDLFPWNKVPEPPQSLEDVAEKLRAILTTPKDEPDGH